MSDLVSSFSQRLETYVGPDRAQPVKHVFRQLLSLLDQAGDQPAAILDVGCATGDLLAVLGTAFPDAALRGIDTSAPLVAIAKERASLAAADIVVADGLAHRGPPADLVTCFGLLGVFDSFEPMLEALLANTAPGGVVAVHALFNPDDIDVRVAYRDNAYGPAWQRGFNIFSQAGIARWLTERSLAAVFHEVRLPFDLPKRPHQPHRAHTVQFADGSRHTVNGLRLWLPESLLMIRKGA